MLFRRYRYNNETTLNYNFYICKKMKMLKYNRILLKLSGESLLDSDGTPISPTLLNSYVRQIADLAKSGVQVAVVIGGGNIFRGLSAGKSGVDRITGDYMGMLATVINSLALCSALKTAEVSSKVFTAIRMEPVADYYNREKVINSLEEGNVAILAAGTSNPFFTTDTAAALRGVEINADIILKGTRVDGIYTADPEKDKSATMISEITFDEAYSKNLKVMDMTAFTMCRDNNIPIIVFNINKKENLPGIIKGEKIGTIVRK
jgi:uridylate kinase